MSILRGKLDRWRSLCLGPRDHCRSDTGHAFRHRRCRAPRASRERSYRSGLTQTLGGCLALALVLGVGSILVAVPVASASAPQHSARIDPQVLQSANQGSLDRFFVVLRQQADLSGAAAMATKAQKGAYVLHQLQQVAHATQGPVVAELKRLGYTATPYFLINEILATKSTAGVPTPTSVTDIAAFPGVAAIDPDPVPTPEGEPLQGSTTSGSAGLATSSGPGAPPPGSVPNGWNVDWIGARQLQQQGVAGRGIVVGTIDTGVDDTQPLLTTKYRGYQGPNQPTSDNYNWFDPSGTCSSPCDTEGHGTFTTSEMVSDGIGVAPGAQWIACRGLGPGASRATVLACLQWMLAPTDASGKNPDPAMAPDVVSNSFICPFCNLQAAFGALTAAGIYNVVTTGNFGPTCGSVFDPGTYVGLTAAGALGEASDLIAPYSSRGPVQGGPDKPDITAPGTNVVGAALGSGFTTMSGTSMAAPEVAGAVALLWSSDPSLDGNITATSKALFTQATPELDGSCGPSTVPNAVYGNGELHVGPPGPQITSVVPASLPQGGSGVLRVLGSNFEPGAYGTFDPGSGAGVTVESTTFVSSSEVDLHVSVDPAAPLGQHPLSLIEPNGGAVTAGLSPRTDLPSFTVGAPSMSMSFGSPSIPVGVSTSLSFTIGNLNATSSLTGVGFSDDLPIGLQVATPNAPTNGCTGGTLTADSATRLIRLSGATLAAASSCTMTVRVTGIAAGGQTNTTGVITSNEGGDGPAASASLRVAPSQMAAIPVAMTATPHGLGYWVASSNGAIAPFGGANYYGAMNGHPLNKPVLGIARTPSGHGYWEVAADGGIFAFGDAGFFGSMGGKTLNAPVVGLAATPDGRGYWEVAADGGIFSLGNAQYFGSTLRPGSSTG